METSCQEGSRCRGGRVLSGELPVRLWTGEDLRRTVSPIVWVNWVFLGVGLGSVVD